MKAIIQIHYLYLVHYQILLIKIQDKKKHFLMGDMLELGKHSKRLHEKFSNIINKSKIDKIHIYGKDVKETFKGIKKKKVEF